MSGIPGGKVDKRWCQRITVGMDVAVYAKAGHGTRMFRARTSDIGLGGAFLATHGVELRNHAELQLVLGYVSKGDDAVERVDARVVRKTQDGIGLRFINMDTRRMHLVRAILLDGHPSV
jgi:hypothetical protein